MILPYNVFLDTVKKYNLTAHLSEIHHRYKEDDDLGRLLFDYTNGSSIKQ